MTIPTVENLLNKTLVIFRELRMKERGREEGGGGDEIRRRSLRDDLGIDCTFDFPES
jgi:hypothetical protein